MKICELEPNAIISMEVFNNVGYLLDDKVQFRYADGVQAHCTVLSKPRIVVSMPASREVFEDPIILGYYHLKKK